MKSLGKGSHWLVVSAAAALTVGSLSACSSDSGEDSEVDLLRLGTIGSVESMNPFTSGDTLTASFYTLMYPRLVQYSLPDLELVPDFASAWEVSNDGKTWTFTIREGNSWSDGEPLSVDDAAFTLGTMLEFREDATAAWSSVTRNMKSVSTPDDSTLVVKYEQAAADSLSQLSRVPILPQHVWEPLTTGDGQQLREFANVPTDSDPLVAGGPYELVKYTTDQAALFEVNENYYGKAANIERLGVQFFKNGDAQVAAIKADQIDVATGNPSLSPTDIEPLSDAGFRIQQQEAAAYNDLIINTNPEKKTNRELLDPDVREAMEYATDRDKINEVAMLGYATSGASIVPPATGNWFNEAVQPLPYDIAEANRLLDDGGYELGPDGIRLADGEPMAYEMLISPDLGGAGNRVGEIIRDGFAEIGIDVRPVEVDNAALEDAIFEDDYRIFDLALWGWDTEIDPSYILDAMTCEQFGNNNDSGYCNPEYDRLNEQQAVTVDVAERREIVNEMQQMVFDDRPYVVLHYLQVVEAWADGWSEVPGSPTGFLNPFSNQPMLTLETTG